MAKSVASFEQEVRRIVRRGSKSSEYESSIEEVGTHFGDLVDEEIARGRTEPDAIAEARKRIGSPLTIALQILSSSERVSRGVRLQRRMALGLLLSACCYLVLTYCVLRGWQGQFMGYLGCLFFAGFFSVGLLYGYGALQARRLEWKPLLAVAPVILATFTLVHLAFEPLYRSYASYLGMESQQPMTVVMALDSALGATVRFVVIFGIMAALSYLSGTVWIQRFSWLRLQRVR